LASILMQFYSGPLMHFLSGVDNLASTSAKPSEYYLCKWSK